MKVTKNRLDKFIELLESKLNRKLKPAERRKVAVFMERKMRQFEPSFFGVLLDLFLKFLKTPHEKLPSIKENRKGHRWLRPVEESEKEN
jgi:hypothetical protein